MVILSKACKPDNLESNNSLKLSFVNIRGRLSNCVDCESDLESNSPGILALCETNLDDSIDSDNFSVKDYLSLIQKDSSTHMHGLAVYVKEGLPFAQDLSLENSADSCIFLSQTNLLIWLTFLLGSQTVILTVLLFWISFFLLTLVFVLQWLSLHWEILIMLLSQFPSTFH